MTKPLVLSYAGCSTCKKALRWLEDRGVEADVRPIVEEPPTKAELSKWIPASGKPVQKWLNTSGLSYRALGKAKFDAASDAEIAKLLSADGKLVKRPVLVKGDTVLVGFKEDEWKKAFA
ncbi:MAG: ArsC family transcriptional regulator [Archangium gephyra]|uniref:ArsC family transcriptional regulator n=1 Tax=Archangium gephyra TaxID=48 RepID=A0A2W5STP7_9BACT|nr:MAG: ArsC family transcriptional regulator [Archangium gephyra]